MAFLVFLTLIPATVSASLALVGPVDNVGTKKADGPQQYNYFAYGSNMASATMTSLRGIEPVASTAAVLPGHRLRFNVPGDRLIEPSWASVEPIAEADRRVAASQVRTPCEDEEIMHGVLYRLTEEDFSRILRSEGVPFGYRVHRCRVVPYSGDSVDAGMCALSESGALGSSVSAYTLRAARKEWRDGPDIAPSQSYLDVLIRGAREYGLDAEYVTYLEGMEGHRSFLPLIGDGIAGKVLDLSMWFDNLSGRN